MCVCVCLCACIPNLIILTLQSQDKGIQESIAELLKGYTTILTSSKSNEDGKKCFFSVNYFRFMYF